MTPIQAKAPPRIKPKPHLIKKPEGHSREHAGTNTAKPALVPNPHIVDKKTEDA